MDHYDLAGKDHGGVETPRILGSLPWPEDYIAKMRGTRLAQFLYGIAAMDYYQDISNKVGTLNSTSRVITTGMFPCHSDIILMRSRAIWTWASSVMTGQTSKRC